MKRIVFYPGKLEIGVAYKKNHNMGQNLAYLSLPDSDVTGRVENYVLKDEKNLAHREDLSKKISVFLPESYDGTTPHDILYFFDAQNLFANAGHYTDNGDPYGSWQLDLVITALHRQFGHNIIVVGIDNADMYRSQELFMNPPDFGELSPLATAIPEDDFSRGYLDGQYSPYHTKGTKAYRYQCQFQCHPAQRWSALRFSGRDNHPHAYPKHPGSNSISHMRLRTM